MEEDPLLSVTVLSTRTVYGNSSCTVFHHFSCMPSEPLHLNYSSSASFLHQMQQGEQRGRKHASRTRFIIYESEHGTHDDYSKLRQCWKTYLPSTIVGGCAVFTMHY